MSSLLFSAVFLQVGPNLRAYFIQLGEFLSFCAVLSVPEKKQPPSISSEAQLCLHCVPHYNLFLSCRHQAACYDSYLLQTQYLNFLFLKYA